MRFPRMLTKLNRVTRTPGMQKEQFRNSFFALLYTYNKLWGIEKSTNRKHIIVKGFYLFVQI
jgi:hypothetical protein